MRPARTFPHLTRALTTYASSTIPPQLRPSVPVSDLGLPSTPLPPLIPSIPSTPLDRAALHKLCTLAALDPPIEGSEAEAALLRELGELVGLMDLVGKAEPEPDVGGLLSAAVGEFVMGSDEGEVSREPLEGDENRRLLGYATRRVGDFYGFKAAARK